MVHCAVSPFNHSTLPQSEYADFYKMTTISSMLNTEQDVSAEFDESLQLRLD